MTKNPTQVADIKLSYCPTRIGNKPILCSRDAYDIIQAYINKDTCALQESFLVMYLNQSNTAIGIYTHSLGGITSTVVDIRLVLAVALTSASTGIILAHNHPSGALKPSPSDLTLTKRIRSGCKLLDIKLYDHLIISPDEAYYSMSDEGDL